MNDELFGCSSFIIQHSAFETRDFISVEGSLNTEPPKSRLDQISTRWDAVRDPVRFVMRYAPAIERFLRVLVKNPQDAEDVSQEFLAGVFRRGFPPESNLHGRFRNYLIAAVRNAARAHFRGKSKASMQNTNLEDIPDPHEPQAEAEREWLNSWRQCLLDRVWEALENHQRQSPDSHYHVVLRLAADHPDADSQTLAHQAGLRPDAFRKQLSRARRKFAELLMDEVARTLALPTQAAIEEELIELGLMAYVREQVQETQKPLQKPV
jgi:RNA polymerase sigma-70 factor (ECF subfamily)